MGGSTMKNIWDILSRRQFIQSSAVILGGIVSFALLGFPHTAKAQSEKAAEDLTQYICEICGYVYDPAKGDSSQGIPPGTPFKKLPDGWRCPICGVDKTMFKRQS
jgi:rubredoxin